MQALTLCSCQSQTGEVEQVEDGEALQLGSPIDEEIVPDVRSNLREAHRLQSAQLGQLNQLQAPSVNSQDVIRDISQVFATQMGQLQVSLQAQVAALQEQMKSLAISAPQTSAPSSDNVAQVDAKTFSGLQHFFPHNPGFKSIEQGQAVQISTTREQNLLAILATGGGKSLIWQIPVWLESASKMTTVVFAPLTTLLDDIEKRCMETRLTCAVWRSGVPMSQFDVVLASFESASQKGFQEWLTFRASEKKDIGRIVVDECDYLLENMDFRPSMAALMTLVTQAVPLILITATLPPSSKARLLQLYNLSNIRTIRAPTHRPNLSYQFRPLSARGGSKNGQFEALLQGIQTAMKQHHGVGLGMIFCRKKEDLEKLYNALSKTGANVLKYYSGINDNRAKAEQDQRDIMTQWKTPTEGICWLLCTNIMSRGVDRPDVNVTIHAGVPTSCSEFIQESGRAGRGGQSAKCFIVYTWKPEAPLDDQGGMYALLQALETNICRRIPLYNYLDGQGFSCFTLGAQTARCDNCVSAMKALATQKQKRKAEQQEVPEVGKSIRLGAAEALQRNSVEALDRVLPHLMGQLGQKCRCCFVRGVALEVRSHHIWKCPQLPDGFNQSYSDITKSISDLRNKIRSVITQRQIKNQCFTCLLPQTSVYHKASEVSKGNSHYTVCMFDEDLIQHLLWSIWHDSEAGLWIRSTASLSLDEEDTSAYVQWMLGESGRGLRMHKILAWLNQRYRREGSGKQYIDQDEDVQVV